MTLNSLAELKDWALLAQVKPHYKYPNPFSSSTTVGGPSEQGDFGKIYQDRFVSKSNRLHVHNITKQLNDGSLGLSKERCFN